MSSFDPPFEIHVHGDIPLREDVTFDSLQDLLKPLWSYVGARSLTAGAGSLYEDEPGIRVDAKEHVLHLCWTVRGDDDFRQQLDDLCMNLNDVSRSGAQIEVTFYDAEYDDEDEAQGRESRDDFLMLFVGPTPAAIMQIQRDLLVQDVVGLMERHFEATELTGVVSEIDKLFGERFEALTSSLDLSRTPRGGAPGGSGHIGSRRPRHLH